jgi:hypothetical protein
MITQEITLKITVEDDYKKPNEWDWQSLLDLAPWIGESVEIISVKNGELQNG